MSQKHIFGSFSALGCFLVKMAPTGAIFTKSPGGPWASPGPPWAPLGDPWDPLGTLGTSWEVLGGPVGAHRAPWGALGCPWDVLGGPLWPPGAPRGADTLDPTAQAQSNREVPGAPLGSPLGPLRATLGPPGGTLGSPRSPWTPPGPP